MNENETGAYYDGDNYSCYPSPEVNIHQNCCMSPDKDVPSIAHLLVCFLKVFILNYITMRNKISVLKYM